MVGVGVVGVGLVGALQALVGVVGVVVAVGCRRAPAVVVRGQELVLEGQELVLVGALPPKHIWGFSVSFSSFTSFLNYYDFDVSCFLLVHGVVPMW